MLVLIKVFHFMATGLLTDCLTISFGILFLTGTETDRIWNLHGDGRILSITACSCSKSGSFKRERIQQSVFNRMTW